MPLKLPWRGRRKVRPPEEAQDPPDLSSASLRPDDPKPFPVPDQDSLFDPNDDMAFKVMLLGDSCTGKTCLLIRFKDGTFLANNFISTVGIDYRNKVVETTDGTKVKLQIWDTAGQERFRSVTQAYYRDADALILLFDLTNPLSFANIRSWMDDVAEYASPKVKVYMVGNKSDAESMRKVSAGDAEAAARAYGVPYVETSAKTGANVPGLFHRIAQELAEAKLGHRNGGVKLEKVDEVAAGGWCSYSSYCGS